MPDTVAVAADHGGYDLKTALLPAIAALGFAVLDLGTNSHESVDYPDYAAAVAGALADGRAQRGVVICGSGIGVSIAANRHKGVRAALCHDGLTARLARQHNDANVLALGGRLIGLETAKDCLATFLTTRFDGGRHDLRLAKLGTSPRRAESPGSSPLSENPSIMSVHAAAPIAKPGRFFSGALSEIDPEIAAAIGHELERQQTQIELIASENIVSRAVLEAQGTMLTNKYAEGYPGRRYYGGCEFVDVVETLAIERAKRLFGCGFANVQPSSGSQANQAVLLALLKPGDTTLGMSLAAGGHLTHGAPPNLSGKWFDAVGYGVRREDALIDIDEVARLARERRPKLIIAGGSAYPRIIDFARFREIADEVGAYFMVDMAHFAGLVAGGAFPSPLPHAHVVTTTTHKTLRGPRGGMVLTNDPEIAKKINSAVFPGLQGGPLMHVIAAKAVAFAEALQPSFTTYARAVVDNAQALAAALVEGGLAIVSGGTDCHLLLVDLRPKGLTGKIAEAALERAGMTCNKNGIPFDPEKPTVTSGVRLGTPAATTRGFAIAEFREVAAAIIEVLDGLAGGTENVAVERRIRERVRGLCARFPIYPDLG